MRTHKYSIGLPDSNWYPKPTQRLLANDTPSQTMDSNTETRLKRQEDIITIICYGDDTKFPLRLAVDVSPEDNVMVLKGHLSKQAEAAGFRMKGIGLQSMIVCFWDDCTGAAYQYGNDDIAFKDFGCPIRALLPCFL